MKSGTELVPENFPTYSHLICLPDIVMMMQRLDMLHFR